MWGLADWWRTRLHDGGSLPDVDQKHAARHERLVRQRRRLSGQDEMGFARTHTDELVLPRFCELSNRAARESYVSLGCVSGRNFSSSEPEFLTAEGAHHAKKTRLVRSPLSRTDADQFTTCGSGTAVTHRRVNWSWFQQGKITDANAGFTGGSPEI